MEDLLQSAIQAAIEAGDAILKVYHSDEFGETAKDDRSPLTKADLSAHQIISEKLKETDLPILSEEGKSIPFDERKNWERFWMLDPLDGTKEFLKKNGEFTVNIALIENGSPILGVVHAPVLHETYWASQGQGAFFQEKDADAAPIKVSEFSLSDEKLKITGSRSHFNEDTQKFLDKIKSYDFQPMGSSLKFMLVAKGEVQIYPRNAPTMEWDTAASQIIVEEAGGKVLQFEGRKPVVYNKADLLNPYFIALGKMEETSW